MLKTIKINRKAVIAGFGLTASTALIAGLAATPTAEAKDLGSGNTFGEYGIGWDSTYTIPLASGGTAEGFCLDPYLAAPMQSPNVTYGEPEAYPISGDAKMRMATALYLGKIAIEQPQALDQFKQGVSFLKNLETQIDDFQIPAGLVSQDQIDATKAQIKAAIPQQIKDLPDVSGWDQNVVAAAASVIVHEEGSANSGAEGNGRWAGGDRYLTDQRAADAYNQMKQLADALIAAQNIPLIGAQIASILNVDITQRKPSDWQGTNNGHQRMVSVSDLQFPALFIPGFNFELPQITPTPGSTQPTKPVTPGQTTTPVTDRPDSTTPTTPTNTTSTSKTTPKTPEGKITIRTSAGTKEENVVEKGKTITDTVVYEGLEKGKKYTLTGELVNKETGEKTGDKGEVTFTAEKSKGEQDVEIKIDNADASELVVFESLKEAGKDKVIAKHEDVEDKAQTIGKPEYTPEIRTRAESSTGNVIQTGTTVNDTVSYNGLEPGKTYRLEAKLMCKSDGTDTGASQSITFTPDATSGEVVVQNIAVTNPDCTEQVVFERLYDNDTGDLVAVHEDITDAAQTVGGPASEVQKKKKKVAPVEEKVTPSTTPEQKVVVPNMSQQQNQNQTAPAAGAPGGTAVAPRQVIAAVPSGGADTYGSTAFNR